MEIKLTFLGDIMCKAQMIPAYESEKSESKYCFDSIFEPMRGMFQNADYVFANLETPISMDSTDLTDAKFCFNSPYAFADAVKKAGINFVSTANNHCLDRGVKGINSTIDSLDKVGLIHTGTFKKPNNKPCFIDVNGLKIGVLAYTYGTNAFSNHCYLPHNEYWRVNLFQNQELSFRLDQWDATHKGTLLSRVYHKFLRFIGDSNESKPVYERKERDYHCKKHLIKDINLVKRENPDFIIMFMHAGGQYNPAATKETKGLAEFLTKNGVNIVAGSHEHVVHGGDFSKLKDNKLVTYSLGNFDGTAGVYDAPFDKMSEYSIAWHVYIDTKTKRLTHTSFSILKTVPDSTKLGKIVTFPLSKLYQLSNNEEKIKLENDAQIIAERFLGKIEKNCCNVDEIEII